MLTIRRATEEDVETLFDIRTAVRENALSCEELAALGITLESVREMLRRNYAAWIVEVDGIAAGFAMADRTERAIFAVFVRPEFEGRGAGQRALCAAEDWLASRGVEEAWLSTGENANLRAHGFYNHLGWQATGHMPDGQVRYTKRLSSKSQ